jgi:hypothetical protein
LLPLAVSNAFPAENFGTFFAASTIKYNKGLKP